MTETSESWRDQGENMGLNEETARIELYCNYRDKETWEQEAGEHGFGSLNEYLRSMIDLGRAYREEDPRRSETAEDRIQELEAEIEALEEELAAQETDTIDPEIVDPALVESLLEEEYQTVEEILEQLTENEDLQANLKTPVEDALYDLAAEDRATYERGWGWRLGGDQ